MRDGKMLLERALGVADIEKNVSASKSTAYPVGSVTKQFTAALVLKQVDRGRLTLTDAIGKHLAGLTAEVGTITIEQLRNHTSGLKRAVIEPESRFENMSVESLLTKAAGGKLEKKPGTTGTARGCTPASRVSSATATTAVPPSVANIPRMSARRTRL